MHKSFLEGPTIKWGKDNVVEQVAFENLVKEIIEDESNVELSNDEGMEERENEEVLSVEMQLKWLAVAKGYSIEARHDRSCTHLNLRAEPEGSQASDAGKHKAKNHNTVLWPKNKSLLSSSLKYGYPCPVRNNLFHQLAL